MILNFHFAMGILFQSAYLTNGFGLPVVGGLSALGDRRTAAAVQRLDEVAAGSVSAGTWRVSASSRRPAR